MPNYANRGSSAYRDDLDDKGEIKMRGNQILGLALLVGGIIVLFFGYQSSQALDDQLFEAFTGRFTDSTMWLFIAGGVSTVVGLVLLIKR
jgi:uncharacterized membrane protein HdeD (DUF308 family)